MTESAPLVDSVSSLADVDEGLKKPNISTDQVEVPDAETADYLGSFNIDMGSSTDTADTPHYIINLNVYNTDESAANDVPSVDGLATLPVGGPIPSTSNAAANIQSTDSNDKLSSAVSSLVPQPYLRPMGRNRGRGRGRHSAIPLDDVMEKKIRTFEGVDCVQHLEELQRLFPRFKRAHINRIFTRNMLNFDKTFQQLNEENSQQIAKYASVRLVPLNKPDRKSAESKTNKSEVTPLNPQGYLYLGIPLGRCPPSVASTLYRRVIVNPDGSVDSADERELKYLDSTGQKPTRAIFRSSLLKSDSDTIASRNSQLGKSRLDGRSTTVSPLLSTKTPAHPGTPSRAVGKPENDTQTPNLTSSTSKTIAPPRFTALGVPIETKPKGNRFFRTNRVCETEIKKRGYVDRELRNTKVQPATTNRRSRGSTQKDADSDDKEGDAVKYMASVGVVSTPSTRKTSGKCLTKQGGLGVNDVKEVVQTFRDDGLDLTNDERKNILEFFNQARSEELALMPGCSRKTSQVIISLRPFQDTLHLLNRLSGTRFLSPNLIDASKEVLQMRSTVVRLLQRCERITERVATHASSLLANDVSLPTSTNLSAAGGETPSDRDKTSLSQQLLTQQPAILNPLRELKPYQLVGLNWLRLLHHEKVNGILADEMGLGKTIQAIAFLASLWENGDRGPHLIICPSSTQDNWQRELSEWCSHLKVLVYQGPSEQRKAMRLKIYEAGTRPDFNILLTSYAIGTSTLEDRALMKRVDFHYGIFDEAHMLKNMSSQRFRHLSNFRVQRRLLLTGTPLQNNLLELVSLLSFLMPELFARSTDLLKRMFQIYSKPVNERENDDFLDLDSIEHSNFETERLDQAKNLLQPFFLRRLKSQVLDQLPSKSSEIVHVPMTDSQSEHYWALVERLRRATSASSTVENGSANEPSQITKAEKLEEDTEVPLSKRMRVETSVLNGIGVKKTKTPNQVDSPSNMIVQLRKAANHQALLSGIAFSEASLRDIAETLHLDPSHSNSDPHLILEDLSVLSDHQVHKICQFYDILSSYTLPIETIMQGSGKLAWLDAQLPKMIENDHRILIFSQFIIVLDLLEEFLRSRDLRYLRLDGSTPVNERQELVDRFNSSSIEVFLLSTRAGGLGINLTGADTVIIHDIDFNPYNDRQAEDRVHRLGQTRPVHVIRLISADTVEDGILKIASEKLAMEQNVTGTVKPDLDEQESVLEEVNPDDEFTESDEVVLKILGSSLHSSTKVEDQSSAVPRPKRVTDRELWSLLEDTLKTNE